MARTYVKNPLTGRLIFVGGPTFLKIYMSVVFSAADRKTALEGGYNVKGAQASKSSTPKKSSPTRKKKVVGRVRALEPKTPERRIPFPHNGCGNEVIAFTILDSRGTGHIKFEHNMLCGGVCVPILYSMTPSLTNAHRLPKQTNGTCYFHSMMNALINQPHFACSLLVHLVDRVRMSAYARRDGESDIEVNERRFGPRVGGPLTAALTVQRKFRPSESMMATIYSKVNHNADLRNWARDVMLISMIKGAMDVSGEDDRWEAGYPAFDAQIALALAKWEEGKLWRGHVLIRFPGPDMEPISPTNLANKFQQGAPMLHSLQSLLVNCGLQVRRHRSVGGDSHDVLIARVPDDGATLCIGSIITSNPFLLEPRPAFNVPTDGSASGMVMLTWYGGPTNPGGHGHGMAWVKNRDNFAILDSNGYTWDTMEKAIDKYVPLNAEYYYCDMWSFYACQTESLT